MTFLDMIATRLGYIKATNEPAPRFLLATAEHERYNIPDGSLYENQAELYQRLTWVFIAVSTVAQIAASVQLNVKKLRGERARDIENHEFELLLRQPNPHQSRFEFLKATFAYILLTGNAYWHLNRASENEPPKELWVIQPHRIRPEPDGRSYIKGYVYDPGAGPEILLEPWQIAHFKDFHPNNLFMGLSRVEPVATVARGDLEMQKWNTKLFGKNNARLPGILAFSDPINDTDWEIIKKDVDEAAVKRMFLMLRNAGKGGVEWMQAAATLKDMEFLAGRNFTKEEIFSVFAPGLSSVLAVNATEANARTGKATLIDFAVWPMLTSVSEKITANVLPAYVSGSTQLSLVAEFEDIRVIDRAMELQEMTEYAKTHTIDEIREKYYEDKPLADATEIEDDERGKLLPAQIAAGSGAGASEPEAEPGLEIPEAFGEFLGEGMGEEAIEAELKAWEKFAIARLGKKSSRSFVCKVVPANMRIEIAAKLATVKTADEIKAVFAKHKSGNGKPNQDALATIAAELKRANDLLEASTNGHPAGA